MPEQQTPAKSEQLEYTNDPKAYQFITTLHEDNNLVFEAEYGLPDGLTLSTTKPASNSAPVKLVRKRVGSQFKGIPATAAGSADTAIAAIRLAWDFLKDGRPVASIEGASTAVLGSEDMAWDHYAAAQKFSSPTYSYRVKNIFGAECVRIDYVARGSCKARYDGKKDVRDGDYMPNVEVFCSKVDLAWGWNAHAKAMLSHLTNVGPKGGKVIPDFYATLSFDCGTIFHWGNETFSYMLRGDKGFAGKA